MYVVVRRRSVALRQLSDKGTPGELHRIGHVKCLGFGLCTGMVATAHLNEKPALCLCPRLPGTKAPDPDSFSAGPFSRAFAQPRPWWVCTFGCEEIIPPIPVVCFSEVHQLEKLIDVIKPEMRSMPKKRIASNCHWPKAAVRATANYIIPQASSTGPL